MISKEEVIRNYFQSWLCRDASVLEKVFADDVLYVECYGPAYRGLDEIRQWFDDWNQRGSVLRWDIGKSLIQENTAVCNWYFECIYDGETSGFNGVSWILFDVSGKISELREYQSKTPNYFPYHNLELNWKNKGMDFQLAGMEDLPEVWRIFQDVVEYHKTQGIAQWDEVYPDRDTIENDIKNGQMYLLTENGAVVAAVVLNEEQDTQYQTGKWKYTNGKIAVIHRLCVKPTEQHKGLGRKMMQLAEQELRRQGYRSVRLDAFTHNPFSCRLYESIGYRRTGEVLFRKGRFYLYEKTLHNQEEWQ